MPLVALIAKDVRLHGRAVAAAQAGAMALMALAFWLRPEKSSVNAALVLNFNVFLAGFWSEWLIAREKTKGTFAWLRAAPLTDRDLVLSKFLAAGGCVVALWSVSAALLSSTAPLRVPEWTVSLLGLLAFSGLAVSLRLRFGPRLGQILPYAILFVPLAVVVAYERMTGVPIDLAGSLSARGQLATLGAAFVLAWLGILFLTIRWVRRSDTFRLLE